ncbi:MAG: type II toxin-antitoxin system VapC family toxin [Bacteroidales bacterium]|nr:type II toxin-antitoxin system VapC family toxin [Bacteroidales bacterium]
MKLIDSNILIYSARKQYEHLRHYFNELDVYVSAISRLEVMGYYKLTSKDKNYFNAVFNVIKIINISDEIINEAIAIRQLKRLSVGDAIIGATALYYDYELVTHNTNDFKHIENLKLIDPIK